MDLTTRRRLYALCRDEPLEPDDRRNVDFDHLGRSGDLAVRGVSWVERLAAPIELSDLPTRQLMTGLPGSGKSTELRRLGVYLSRERAGRAGYLVARVDAEDAFDLTQAIDLPDVIAVLVDGAERAVLVAEGAPNRGESSSSFLVRTWHWLTETEIELKDIEIGGGPAKLALEMKTRPAFRQQVRASLTRHFTRFLQESRAELVALDARARSAGWQGLCLILDSLEKLRGLDSNWMDVLESAVRVFGSGAPYLKLPVHCLFTVPPALVNRLNADVEFMPMIKLRDRSGETFASGYEALRELVRRRIPDPELEQLLGPGFEDRLKVLIDRSGGYPRELVLALRWLLELPRLPAEPSDLERLNNESRERFRSLVTDEDLPWLARVAVEKTLPVPTEEDRPMVDRAIQNNIVLRYLNNDTWFELHPAVLEIRGVQDAIAKLKGA